MGRLLVVTLLLSTTISAQTTFRSQTELVLVPTVVTDKAGHPITGLDRDSFTLLEDGKRQKVAIFEESTPSSGLIQRAPVANDEYTNAFAQPAISQRLTIIVLDMIHTAPVDQIYVREQLISWLTSTANEQQPIALVVLSPSRLQVIHDFTTDPKVLIEALGRVRTRLPETSALETVNLSKEPTGKTKESEHSIAQAEQEMRELSGFPLKPEEQIGALQRKIAELRFDEYLQEMAQALAGVPGRKAAIWISSTAPRPLPETVNKLVNSQIAIYPVDVRGLTTPGYDTPNNRSNPLTKESVISATSANGAGSLYFRLVADETGGRAFFNRNDFNNSFREAIRDSSAYYLLGFYRRLDDHRVGWRNLSVKVNRKGTQVRARSKYLVPGNEDYMYSDKSSVELALESPWNFSGLPLTVRFLQSKPSIPVAKTAVGFEFRLPDGLNLANEADNHLRLEFTAVAFNGAGKQVAEVSERIDKHMNSEEVSSLHATGVSFESHFDIAPGSYIVKIVVRDELTGRIGSVAAPLVVEEMP